MLPDAPATVLRPQYARSVILPRLLPLIVFAALFTSFVLALVLTIAFGTQHEPFDDVGSVPGWVVFLVLCGLGLIAGMPVTANAVRRAYVRSEYRLGEDAVEYRLDWLFSKRKTVPYARVVEVSWSAGPLQRKAGLGTVRLSTPAAAGEGSGLRMVDLPRPEDAYREMLRRVEAVRKQS